MQAKRFSFITKLPVDFFKEKILIYFILDSGQIDDAEKILTLNFVYQCPSFPRKFFRGFASLQGQRWRAAISKLNFIKK